MLTVKDIAKFKKEAGIRQSNKSTGDGNGLTICTAPKKKSAHQWFEGRFRYHGKSDSHYLGTYGKKLSLKDARIKWDKIYRWYHQNDCLLHPKLYKDEESNRSRYLLIDAVNNYFRKKNNLKPSTLKDNKNKIYNLILPALGEKTPLKLLEWDNGGRKTVQDFLYRWTVQGKHDSERKLRGLLRQVLDLAIEDGMMPQNTNPAIKNPVPLEVKEVKHHPTITWAEVPTLLNKIESNSVNGAIEVVLAVKFLLMTFLRVGALVRLEWDWYDEETDCWVIPSETWGLKRKKGVKNRPHYIPVTKELRLLMADLKEINGHSKYVFFSNRGRRTKHICNDAPNNHLKRLDYKGILNAHGWRQVPTTVGQEVLKVAPDIIKRQLGHLTATGAFKAYDSNTEMIEERRQFLSEWTSALVGQGLKVGIIDH